MSTRSFTLDQGLDVQNDDLTRWSTVLNSSAFAALWREAQRQNKLLPKNADGYAVWRGGNLTEFVCNYSLRFAPAKDIPSPDVT
jgi:hypothetical protein